MPSATADKLARLIKEALPLAKTLSRACHDRRADLVDRCGVELVFLKMYLDKLTRGLYPADDDESPELKVIADRAIGLIESRGDFEIDHAFFRYMK